MNAPSYLEEAFAALHQAARRFRRRDAGAACTNARLAEALVRRLEGHRRFPHAHVESPEEFAGLSFVVWGSEGEDLEEILPRLAGCYRVSVEWVGEDVPTISVFMFNGDVAPWLEDVCVEVTQPAN